MKRRHALLFPMAGGTGIGPLSQLLAVAEALELSGWLCTIACSAQRHRMLSEEAGFAVRALPEPAARRVPFVDYRLADVLYFAGVLEVNYLRSTLAVESALMRELQPDALVTASHLTAPITGAIHGVPVLSIAAGPDLARFSSPLYPDDPGYVRAAAQEMNVVLEGLGLEPVSDPSEFSCQRSTHRLAPTWPEFDPALASLDDGRTTFVGPLISYALELRAGPALPAAPMIVVYLNRGSLGPVEELELVTQLAGSHPELSIAWVNAAETPPVPNIRSIPWVPMYRWLNHAVLLVSGGGYNSLLSAVVRGVPSLILPGRSAERHYNAVQFQAQACGRMTTVRSSKDAAADALRGENAQSAMHTRNGCAPRGAAESVDVLASLL